MFTWKREAKLIFKVNVAKLWKKKQEGGIWREGRRRGNNVGMGKKETREVEVAYQSRILLPFWGLPVVEVFECVKFSLCIHAHTLTHKQTNL